MKLTCTIHKWTSVFVLSIVLNSVIAKTSIYTTSNIDDSSNTSIRQTKHVKIDTTSPNNIFQRVRRDDNKQDGYLYSTRDGYYKVVPEIEFIPYDRHTHEHVREHEPEHGYEHEHHHMLFVPNLFG